jgi:SAM-dependent methyltransferase
VKPFAHESAIGNVRSGLGVIDRMWHVLGAQLRNPTGVAGSIVGWLMALVNDEPNRLAIDALHLGPGETVLELGFGPGWSLRTIAARTRGARVYGVDQSARMLKQATHMNEVAVSSGRMVLVQGPFSPLPWIDEMFDKVLLVNVLYFFDSDGRDISEIHRVLRSGGRLVIYVTSRETMRKWPFAGPGTHRTFDVQDLTDLLVNAGFRPSDIKITNAVLGLGVKGFIGVVEKSDGSIRRDKGAQGRARCSVIRPDILDTQARDGSQAVVKLHSGL